MPRIRIKPQKRLTVKPRLFTALRFKRRQQDDRPSVRIDAFLAAQTHWGGPCRRRTSEFRIPESDDCESVPGELREQAVVLVRIALPVGENQVRIHAGLSISSKKSFTSAPLVRKKSVAIVLENQFLVRSRR